MKAEEKFSWDYSLLIALASGILMGITTAPVSAWPLAWIALAPLWVLVIEGRGSWRSSLLTGLVWGIGYHGVALFWITGIHPMTWMGVPWLASLAIALFCWSFITLWGAALAAAWAACMRAALLCAMNADGRRSPLYVHPRSSALVLIGVAFWCGLESLWSLGSLWWTSLSYTQSPHNLAILHLGQISGPTAVTATMVAVNGLIAQAWIISQKEKVKRLLLPVALCLILHLIGFDLYNRPLIQPAAAALKVGIIQGNIPNEIKLYPGGWRRAIEGYTSGYQTLAKQGVDAVLTPESALPFRWDDLVGGSFYSAVLEKGTVVWLGAFGDQGSSITNSLFTVAGKGKIFSRYDKEKLVPLGEYIPFEQVLGGLVDKLSPLDAHMVPGQPKQLFDTPFGRAIASICYDSAFAEHFRYQAAAGGQFILSAANDAHYSQEMPAQHHAQDVMRAIETDRWAVRATNTGYSAIVDPHGRTKWISGFRTYEIHADTIYRRQTQTLYVLWGDWLMPVLLVGGAIACLYHVRMNANN